MSPLELGCLALAKPGHSGRGHDLDGRPFPFGRVFRVVARRDLYAFCGCPMWEIDDPKREWKRGAECGLLRIDGYELDDEELARLFRGPRA